MTKSQFYIVFLIILLVLGTWVAYTYLISDSSRVWENGEVLELNTFTGEGYRFSYSDGYVLSEDDSVFLEHYNDLVSVVVLMTEADQRSLEAGERQNGEGPPTIQIYRFENRDSLTLEEWLEANQQVSNINLALGEGEMGEVSGLPALLYETDGLYAARNAVFSDQAGEMIYLLRGEFLFRDLELYQEYQLIKDSFEIF